MRLFKIAKLTPGIMLPDSWFVLLIDKSEGIFKGMEFISYLPWIFNGSYVDLCRRLRRFGWRIPRVSIGFYLKGRWKIIRRPWIRFFRIQSPSIHLIKLMWYESI